MTRELIQRHCKGKWKFSGRTGYSFDEMELLIGEGKTEYTRKLRGKTVREKPFPADGHFTGNVPVMTLNGPDAFCIGYPDERTLICAECKNRNIFCCSIR